MHTSVVAIQTAKITDWETFHTVFHETLGFPDYYGRNMDAWIDCMTYVDEDAGMVRSPIQKGDLLTLRLDDATDFDVRCPEQYTALIECTAFVNYRRAEVGQQPVLALMINGWIGKQ